MLKTLQTMRDQVPPCMEGWSRPKYNRNCLKYGAVRAGAPSQSQVVTFSSHSQGPGQRVWSDSGFWDPSFPFLCTPALWVFRMEGNKYIIFRQGIPLFFFFPYCFLLSKNYPHCGAELRTLRSRVTCSTDWASWVPWIPLLDKPNSSQEKRSPETSICRFFNTKAPGVGFTCSQGASNQILVPPALNECPIEKHHLRKGSKMKETALNQNNHWEELEWNSKQGRKQKTEEMILHL